MKVEVISAAALSADQVATWSRYQLADPTLANPFFRPEFFQTVAADRDDVEVAVWHQDGAPVGFLPFERVRRGVGRAVAKHLNEFQGAIVRRDTDWRPQEVLRAAGLGVWKFDHVIAAQEVFAPFQHVVAPSPYIDLSGGFEHYRRSRGKSASDHVGDVLRKDRKAGRELGEVRLVIESQNQAALHELMNWKTEQSRRTNRPDLLEIDWVVKQFKRLTAADYEHFQGMLFSLYMGGTLAAACMGLRTGNVFQAILLGHNREVSRYAPGLVLLMRMCQQAGDLGISRIDFGKGKEAYKEVIASDYDKVTEGAVWSQRFRDPIYRSWMRGKERFRSTALYQPWLRVRRWALQTRVLLGYSE